MALRQIERLGFAPKRNRNVLRNPAKLSFRRFFFLLGNVFEIDLSHLEKLSAKLTRRNPLSGGDCENGNGCPNDVYKGGGIRSIKHCVCGQEEAAADIQELKCRGMSFPFSGGDHCIGHKQSCRPYPSNRIKP